MISVEKEGFVFEDPPVNQTHVKCDLSAIIILWGTCEWEFCAISKPEIPQTCSHESSEDADLQRT